MNLLPLDTRARNQFATEEKKSLQFNSPTLHFDEVKVLCLVLRHSQGEFLAKDSGQNIAHLKEKHLWHFSVNWTVHSKSLCVTAARRICGQQSPLIQMPKSTSALQVQLLILGNLNSYSNKQASEHSDIYRGAAAITSLLIAIYSILVCHYLTRDWSRAPVKAWGSVANTNSWLHPIRRWEAKLSHHNQLSSCTRSLLIKQCHPSSK